ncbi:hypothetical protein [Arsenophonus endosymbiont of Aleurodicus floccissimus]|uniref:hypothetical protein n=1 Tax=Arsenophonus endosymbiont of Aleurodicus floccissimus TaxID=2152761 RepID=UPI0015FECB8E|nr:hypothetical protein [Arsenophonus endosymbiont of Aleurodicus floccissimus]
MSLDARNMTQGGQVIKYMVAMFMQIDNIVAFWVIIATVMVFFPPSPSKSLSRR